MQVPREYRGVEERLYYYSWVITINCYYRVDPIFELKLDDAHITMM